MRNSPKPDVRSLFKRAFAHAPPKVIRVPATLELLGGYTESQRGVICATTVDRYLEIAVAPRNDGRLDLVRENDSQRAEMWIRECVPGMTPGWAAPVAAIVRHLREKRVNVRGFNAAIVNHIPEGIGLGEDAALCLATMLAVRELFPFSIRETGFVVDSVRGKESGLSAVSREQAHRIADACGNATKGRVDGEEWFRKITALRNGAFELTQADSLNWTSTNHALGGEFGLLLFDAGVRDPKRGLHRSDLELCMSNAAERLSVGSLRVLDRVLLGARQHRLSERGKGVCEFAIGECRRAMAIGEILGTGDIAQVGRFLSESHDEARKFAGITAPELDALVDLGRSHSACFGARFTGNATDGGVLFLVDRIGLDEFQDSIWIEYRRMTGLTPSVDLLKPVAGLTGRSHPRNCS